MSDTVGFIERLPHSLVAAFRAYGARSRVPSLWIYARNDSFFRPELVERMRAAFAEGG